MKLGPEYKDRTKDVKFPQSENKHEKEKSLSKSKGEASSSKLETKQTSDNAGNVKKGE